MIVCLQNTVFSGSLISGAFSGYMKSTDVRIKSDISVHQGKLLGTSYQIFTENIHYSLFIYIDIIISLNVNVFNVCLINVTIMYFSSYKEKC